MTVAEINMSIALIQGIVQCFAEGMLLAMLCALALFMCVRHLNHSENAVWQAQLDSLTQVPHFYGNLWKSCHCTLMMHDSRMPVHVISLSGSL